MTEAERFLEERRRPQQQAAMPPQTPPPPPAGQAAPTHAESAAQGGIGPKKGSIINKVFAVIVFLVLLFLGTYFAKVSRGGIGSVWLGYTLGAAAFIFAPMFWNSK
jgi:hypothetical protein